MPAGPFRLDGGVRGLFATCRRLAHARCVWQDRNLLVRLVEHLPHLDTFAGPPYLLQSTRHAISAPVRVLDVYTPCEKSQVFPFRQGPHE